MKAAFVQFQHFSDGHAGFSQRFRGVCPALGMFNGFEFFQGERNQRGSLLAYLNLLRLKAMQIIKGEQNAPQLLLHGYQWKHQYGA